MPRFYLRLSLIPFLLLTAMLFVIRTQPYDDHELRQLLLPTSCPTPCFMGIQPGVTTVEQAIAILEESGWTRDIEITQNVSMTSGENYVAVDWRWNGSQPRSIYTVFPAYLLSYEQDIRSAVDEIQFSTRVPIGTVELLLRPYSAFDIRTGMPQAAGQIPIGLSVVYDKVEMNSNLNCPLKLRDLWKVRTDLTFYSIAPNYAGYSPVWDNRQIIRTLRSICS